jgi:ubiquinone/menaquinone biosynthesis C-methylase UbiE
MTSYAETPDIETSSADYARRFSGSAGAYLLDVQTRTVRRALAGLQPGTVLDVGGGHGQLVDPLQALGWKVTVHGSDAACERNLRELHGKRNCEFMLGDVFALPVPDRSFDLVVAVRLISHIDAWPRLVKELCRVARHSVVIDYPSKTGLNALTPMLFNVKKNFEGNTRTYTSFSRKELETAFNRSGFRVHREVKQFLLPMALHRMGKGSFPFRAAEGVMRGLGLTALLGSPVILRADRAYSTAGRAS